MCSDLAGTVGCRVRLEVGVNDFERFLLVGKGVSAATRECFVRHARRCLPRSATRRTGWIWGACPLPGSGRTSRSSAAGMRRSL
jgi:hypothetical protein